MAKRKRTSEKQALESNKTAQNAKKNISKCRGIEFKLAFLGIIIFILAVAVSIYLTPSYDFLLNYLSELGIGSTALIFNIGVILTGLLLIPFFVTLYEKDKFLPQLITILGVVGMIFFIGVGVFPLTSGLMHTFAAALFFFTTALVMFFTFIEFFSKTFFANTKSCCSTKIFLFATASIIPIALNIALLIFQTPFWQKIAVIGIIIWFIAFSILRKTKWNKAVC
jgi:hypothetical membrane protein